jgi:PAS domain S-box-containing protein
MENLVVEKNLTCKELESRVKELEEEIEKCKRAEKDLLKEKSFSEALIKSLPGVFYVFDQELRNVRWNENLEQVTGYSSEERSRMGPLDTFEGEDKRVVAEAINEVLIKGEGFVEANIASKTGKKTPYFFTGVRAEIDNSTYVVGMGIDITERKRAEEERRQLSRQRLQTCNVMAHELRNALVKLGFVFSAINSVMGFLREQWEMELRKAFPGLEDKSAILMRLGELIVLKQALLGDQKELRQLSEELMAEQVAVANLYLLPEQEKSWLHNKIRPKWRRLLAESRAWEEDKEEVWELLSRLENAIRIVQDEDLAQKMAHLPEDLRIKWQKLACTQFSATNLSLLEDVLHLLDHPGMNIRYKVQLKKLITFLKALADISFVIEDRMNQLLFSLKSGEQQEGFWGTDDRNYAAD